MFCCISHEGKKYMKPNLRIVLTILFLGCIVGCFLYTNKSTSNPFVYEGKLKGSVKNELLLRGDWEVKCYLQPYNENEIPISLEGKMEEDDDPNAHICCFELQYLGEDARFISNIESIELKLDWNRGDEKIYKGKYEIGKKTLIDSNNQVKYFYLPNMYFTPKYLTSLRTEMSIQLKDGDISKYYGYLKY